MHIHRSSQCSRDEISSKRAAEMCCQISSSAEIISSLPAEMKTEMMWQR
jgi:hypothetical protein